MMELEAGLLLQPGLDQFPLMHPQVVEQDVNGRKRRMQLMVEEL